MMDMMELEDVNTSSRWVKLLYYLWKIFTCLFLHLLLIAIVIGYCFFGMFMFQNLESQYEKDTKKNITHIRQNISSHIWNYTHNLKYLHKENWTDGVRISLKDFERQLVWSMRKGGWNGNDSEDSLLWTKDGALFYSIIVITTIAYLKFGFTFDSTPVCGLSRAYKIHFCRLLTKNDPKTPLDVFHLGYDEDRCSRRKIFFKKHLRHFLRNGYWVMALKCPSLYEGAFGERPQFKAVTKFLSASLTDSSVFSYVRRNSWREKLRPNGFVYGISFEDFEQDRRRTREYFQPSYQPENELDSDESMRSLTSLTSRWGLSTPSIEIIFDRDVVEEEVILLANEIAEKRPYERFRRTLYNINVSSWSHDDVAYACSQVLLHQSYSMRMYKHFHKPSENCCTNQRIFIKMAMRDAEWFPRKMMRASKCPPVLGFSFQYFVSGGMQKNSVVFYAQYAFKNFAFPDAFVLRINEIFEENYEELEGEDYTPTELETQIYS